MIRIEVQEGIVRLCGTGARAEDMMHLAEAVSRVAGVKRVVVEGMYPTP
jgi:osmotically-inducible protein OsmY